MAATKKVVDKYVNQATITVTESAANTLTFKKLETGISLFEKVAWLIHRVEYIIENLQNGNLNAAADSVAIALTTTDQITSISLINAAVIDYWNIERFDWGTAATAVLMQKVMGKDFTQLPGGGILVPPNPFYLAVKGFSCASANVVYAKIYYTNIELSPDEYWELVETRRMISST